MTSREIKGKVGFGITVSVSHIRPSLGHAVPAWYADIMFAADVGRNGERSRERIRAMPILVCVCRIDVNRKSEC